VAEQFATTVSLHASSAHFVQNPSVVASGFALIGASRSEEQAPVDAAANATQKQTAWRICMKQPSRVGRY
jgi:hypothetical protein